MTPFLAPSPTSFLASSAQTPVQSLPEHLVPEADALVDAGLGGPGSISVMRSLPLLQDRQRSVRLIVRAGSQVVSHGALLPHKGHRDGVDLRLGVIGGMVTRPDQRGRGHAAAILDALECRARQLELDVLLLWPNGSGNLYTGRGYEPIGREWAGILAPPPPHHHPAVDGRLVRLVGRVPPPDLEVLRRREAWRVTRSREDWRRHLAIPQLEVFGWIDGDRVAAYAVCGKGADLGGHVHELGGPDDALWALLTTLAERRGEIPLLLPPWRKSLIATILAHGGILAERPLCLGRVLTPRGSALGRDLHLSGLDSA